MLMDVFCPLGSLDDDINTLLWGQGIGNDNINRAVVAEKGGGGRPE